MKLKLSDQVGVIAGKHKDKQGKIIKILRARNKIVVEKVNIITKHIKKSAEKPGQRIQFEAPIDASNVELICPNCKKLTRVGYKILPKGKKERICKKCKESVDQEFKKS